MMGKDGQMVTVVPTSPYSALQQVKCFLPWKAFYMKPCLSVFVEKRQQCLFTTQTESKAAFSRTFDNSMHVYAGYDWTVLFSVHVVSKAGIS